MSPTPAELQQATRDRLPRERWSIARFWTLVLAVFAAQVAFVFWLGARTAPAPKKVDAGPLMQLSTSSSNELFALMDPTIFALPHNENFSGAAWLKRPRLDFQSADWSEPAKPLRLDVSRLGTAFNQFMQTNVARPLISLLPFVPDMPATESASTVLPLIKPSSLRIEGEIANRRLLTPIQLPPQTNADLLPNTEIQVLVNARGDVFSAVKLRSSGTDADQLALDQAKHTRFEAVAGDSISIGKMIFDWQTLPAPQTNNASAASP